MQETTIVLDYGSKTFKAGYSTDFPSEEAPRILTPNMVELLRPTAPGQPTTSTSSLHDPPVHFPIQHGRITNISEFEALVHHILYDRAGWIPGEEGSIVIAEPLLTPRKDREAVAQIMFEAFNVNGYFIQDSATLSLYAVGRLSGVVLDIGHGKVCNFATLPFNTYTSRFVPCKACQTLGLASQTDECTSMHGAQGCVVSAQFDAPQRE